MDILIRPETAADHAPIFQLHALAFGQENEGKLVDLLRQDDCYVPELSLVAVLKDKVIGHILFTRIHIVGKAGQKTNSLALAPMGVLPQYQKSGIGGKLIHAGLAKAKELGHLSIIVLGHKDYYPRFGFEPAEKWAIGTHYEVPSEYFMGLELFPGSLSEAQGIVEYSAPFSQI